MVMWMLPLESAVFVSPPLPLTFTVTVEPGGNPPMLQLTVEPLAAEPQLVTVGVPEPPDVCANAGAAGIANARPTTTARSARFMKYPRLPLATAGDHPTSNANRPSQPRLQTKVNESLTRTTA